MHLGLQPVGVIPHRFGVEGVLLVTRRVHHVHATLIAIQHLELFGLERRLLHEIGGGKPCVERVPGDEVAEPYLNEGAEVSRRAVGKIHHPARLPLDHDDVPAANVGCLHYERSLEEAGR